MKKGEDTLGIISWIVIGLIASVIGSKIVNKTGEGLIRDIILGMIGAFVGGWIFVTMGAAGVTGINIYSIFVAVIGAVVVLVAYHAIFGKGPRTDCGADAESSKIAPPTFHPGDRGSLREMGARSWLLSLRALRGGDVEKRVTHHAAALALAIKSLFRLT